MTAKKQNPVVYCIYTENGKTAIELLEESFELYLSRNLRLPVKKTERTLG